MEEATSSDGSSSPTEWEIFRRWQQYDAELRVNVIRLLSVGLFYLVHLANHYSLWSADPGSAGTPPLASPGTETLQHRAVTAVAFAWIIWALMVHRLLWARVFPQWLPAISIGLDGILLTAMLLLGSGAASPLMAGYFLIIVMSGLRFDVRLVQAACVCCFVGYLVVLGCTRWPLGYLLEDPLPRVPRYHQLMMGLALLLTGVTVGQTVRQVRRWFQPVLNVRPQQS